MLGVNSNPHFDMEETSNIHFNLDVDHKFTFNLFQYKTKYSLNIANLLKSMLSRKVSKVYKTP